ncbi:MAG: methylcobalamin:coenzyme M methyltransferase [candidate division TA06 bacterium ADurb.Bin131]|jgi:uroporphyrinogen-III decarboxylase|uniref:Methylcobalamin:coenzyme M methyltransferase n=1 Tax=candidate division TA06 bacterium ADurb.Bin131 TaxID=1852827 RepID=A0A1V6CE10_UNCT6|nr:MAG: methylcobalamin:coenzyme M methyltransferase [candidate division TA06 bacterium ADurb.Bin131]
MTERERMLRCIELRGDGEIFSSVSIAWPVWEKHAEFFEKIKNECPDVKIFAGKDETRRAGNKIRDKWGCLWIYPIDYLDGQVIEHPLDDWSKLDTYIPPDPDKYVDWEKAKKDVKEAKEKGILTGGGIDHGFFFLLLTYLRGYENVMIDFAEENPNLYRLIEIIEDYWLKVIKKWIETGVDTIGFGDDLGLQNSLPISPSAWRKYIKPSFKKFFTLCKENKVHAGLHTDGWIVAIMEDLIECGLSILNPQDLVNGIDNIERILKGRICIDLDIDRQKITYSGTPQDIDEHIFNCVKKLGSQNGGLFMKFGAYPGTPIENIAAVITSFEKYHDYWKNR